MTSQLLGPPFALLLLVGGLALAPVVEARPKLQTPALAVTHPGSTFLALSLTGSGLGTPASGSYVEAQGYVGGVLTVQPVDALSPDIVVWTDVHVVAKLPPDMTRVRARVVTPGGRSARVRADYYQYDWFDTSAAVAGNPTDPALEPGSGHIWIDAEFHRDFGYWDPADAQVKAALYPVTVGTPFHLCIPGCGQADVPTFGEDVTLDASGRVWFTEGGSEPSRYDGPRNHGRVLAYDRAAQTTASTICPATATV